MSLPWKPRIIAAPISPVTRGSHPPPSAMRPHRASSATSSIGVKVQLQPSASDSTAIAEAVRSHSDSSHAQAMASGIG